MCHLMTTSSLDLFPQVPHSLHCGLSLRLCESPNSCHIAFFWLRDTHYSPLKETSLIQPDFCFWLPVHNSWDLWFSLWKSGVSHTPISTLWNSSFAHLNSPAGRIRTNSKRSQYKICRAWSKSSFPEMLESGWRGSDQKDSPGTCEGTSQGHPQNLQELYLEPVLSPRLSNDKAKTT